MVIFDGIHNTLKRKFHIKGKEGLKIYFQVIKGVFTGFHSFYLPCPIFGLFECKLVTFKHVNLLKIKILLIIQGEIKHSGLKIRLIARL